MQRTSLAFKLLVTVLVTAALIGCSKPASEEAPQASSTPGVAKNTTASSPAKTQAVAAAKTPAKRSGSQTADGVPLPSPGEQEEASPQDNASTVQQILEFEGTYRTNADFSVRVELIYKISDVGTPEALLAMGRIFFSETDPELKTEVLNLLADIDGQTDNKLSILTAAIAADQPKDVREQAIDALTDIEPPERAVPILQSLLSDPDAEIREDAKDAVEQLQAIIAAPH